MEQKQINPNILTENKERKKNREEFFSNVFSNIGKFEKNKQYVQLQNDLNLLKNHVKLMEEFTRDNKRKLSNKKKLFSRRISTINLDKESFNNRNQSRRLNSMIRLNTIIKRQRKSLINKSNNPSSNNLKILQTESNNKNINRDIYKNINKKNRNKNKNKILNNRSSNLSLKNNNPNLIYRTEVKNYNELINGQKLPNICLSSDKMSESNFDNKNTNTNSSPRLPIIQDKSKISNQNKIFILSDNDTDSNEDSNNFYHINLLCRKMPSMKNSYNFKDNVFLQKFPNILNQRNFNNNKIDLNHKELPIQTNKIVRKMKKNNNRIKNRINNKLNQQDLINWEMKSRFKLAKWKYGIEDIQKYFIDLEEYGKNEEVELLKRKTFYDYVDEVIDDIKKAKEEKEIKTIEEKYSVNIKEKYKFGSVKKDPKKEKNINNINDIDITLNKKAEQNEVLKKVYLRKIKEQQKRKIINEIMLKNDMRCKAIDESTNRIRQKTNSFNKSKENNKSNISKKSHENDND
jgi:hypothetical protein